jgi:hypothetical protein
MFPTCNMTGSLVVRIIFSGFCWRNHSVDPQFAYVERYLDIAHQIFGCIIYIMCYGDSLHLGWRLDSGSLPKNASPKKVRETIRDSFDYRCYGHEKEKRFRRYIKPFIRRVSGEESSRVSKLESQSFCLPSLGLRQHGSSGQIGQVFCEN